MPSQLPLAVFIHGFQAGTVLKQNVLVKVESLRNSPAAHDAENAAAAEAAAVAASASGAAGSAAAATASRTGRLPAQVKALLSEPFSAWAEKFADVLVVRYTCNAPLNVIAAQLAEKLAECIEPAQWQCAVVHAHSMGGLVAALALHALRDVMGLPRSLLAFDTPWAGLREEAVHMLHGAAGRVGKIVRGAVLCAPVAAAGTMAIAAASRSRSASWWTTAVVAVGAVSAITAGYAFRDQLGQLADAAATRAESSALSFIEMCDEFAGPVLRADETLDTAVEAVHALATTIPVYLFDIHGTSAFVVRTRVPALCCGRLLLTRSTGPSLQVWGGCIRALETLGMDSAIAFCVSSRLSPLLHVHSRRIRVRGRSLGGGFVECTSCLAFAVTKELGMPATVCAQVQ